MSQERYNFENICNLLTKQNKKVDTLLEKSESQWIKELKKWMLQKGLKLEKKRGEMP